MLVTQTTSSSQSVHKNMQIADNAWNCFGISDGAMLYGYNQKDDDHDHHYYHHFAFQMQILELADDTLRF